MRTDGKSFVIASTLAGVVVVSAGSGGTTAFADSFGYPWASTLSASSKGCAVSETDPRRSSQVEERILHVILGHECAIGLYWNGSEYVITAAEHDDDVYTAAELACAAAVQYDPDIFAKVLVFALQGRNPVDVLPKSFIQICG